MIHFSLSPSQSTLGGSTWLDDVQYPHAHTCTCMAIRAMSRDPYQPVPNCTL